MAARGRRSAASFNVVALPDTKPRIEPRDGTPKEIADLFHEIVNSVSRDHFRPSDHNLIEQFCQAVILARQAYQSLSEEGPINRDGRVNAWNVVLEKAHRSSVALSARLRLAPMSRVDAKAVGRRGRNDGTPKPWEPDPQ